VCWPARSWRGGSRTAACLPVSRPSGAPGLTERGPGVPRRFAARFFTGEIGLLAGALAYQFFLSLFPFAILVAAISGALVRYLGLPDVAQLLFRLLEQLPPAVAAPLQAELRQLTS
jgi:uncharacterized BrkB/YihY/UPF0761 family membrane protein